MSDFADDAQALSEAFLERSLNNHAQRKPSTRIPLGYCQNPYCGDEFPAGDKRLFCDGQCASRAK
jgi:hypothetical protein